MRLRFKVKRKEPCNRQMLPTIYSTANICLDILKYELINVIQGIIILLYMLLPRCRAVNIFGYMC